MTSNYCPKCGSHDVEFEEDGIVECMNCGFRGKDFPSEHLLIEDVEEEEENPIKKVVSNKSKSTKSTKAAKTSKKPTKPKSKTTKRKKK